MQFVEKGDEALSFSSASYDLCIRIERKPYIFWQQKGDWKTADKILLMIAGGVRGNKEKVVCLRASWAQTRTGVDYRIDSSWLYSLKF